MGIVVTTLALAASGQASAGPAYDWSGFYAGGMAGAGFGNSAHVTEDEHLSTGQFPIAGGLVGATAGVNWQSGPLVIGGEADIALASVTGSVDGNNNGGNYGCGEKPDEPCTTTLGPMATARLRAGLAVGGALIYGTGGYFVGSVTGDIPGGYNGTGIRGGWIWGGGIELALGPRWTAKAEYLHREAGKFGYVPSDDLFLKEQADLVRFGFNYRPGSGP
jgi:outer membrane immunogenic protein